MSQDLIEVAERLGPLIYGHPEPLPAVLLKLLDLLTARFRRVDLRRRGVSL